MRRSMRNSSHCAGYVHELYSDENFLHHEIVARQLGVLMMHISIYDSSLQRFRSFTADELKMLLNNVSATAVHAVLTLNLQNLDDFSEFLHSLPSAAFLVLALQLSLCSTAERSLALFWYLYQLIRVDLGVGRFDLWVRVSMVMLYMCNVYAIRVWRKKTR